MLNQGELQQIIYNIFETYIKFGGHRYGESLPTIKEASIYFHVSTDTVRLVYLRLKQENYITLNTSVGAVVKVQYSAGDISGHIHDFFPKWKNALFDLSQSAQPLFQCAQWFSLRYAPAEVLNAIEQSCLLKPAPRPYLMAQHLHMIYGTLGNELFMRLIWQIYLFVYAPFLCIRQNITYYTDDCRPLLQMVQFCRQKDWQALWNAVEAYQKQMILAMSQFYQNGIPMVSDSEQLDFTWNIYKKTSQVCYSLGMELLHGVRQRKYPVGSFLPSPALLAKEKHVSVNTVRRTISLLNKLGAAQSINGVGTRILPPFTCQDSTDVSDPIIQKRLLDFAESIQILMLSCRASAEITVASVSPASIHPWIEHLEGIARNGCYELLIYVCFEFISVQAPYQAIKTVYTELLQQLFWGYPLHNLHGNQAESNAFYLPYLCCLKDSLIHLDAVNFSKKLEELMVIETDFTVKRLLSFGIREAASILIPTACCDPAERLSFIGLTFLVC